MWKGCLNVIEKLELDLEVEVTSLVAVANSKSQEIPVFKEEQTDQT